MWQRTATDDTLMQAVSEGDEVAFSELMRRHRRQVCQLLRVFTQDREQAEDLAQEVFARVHRHAGDYTAQGRFPIWLKRITINLAKNFLKQKRGACVPLDEGGAEEGITDNRFDPMAVLMSKGIREEVRATIEALPDEQRLTLVMRYFGDMSVKDIAWAMKCPEGTVKSRLFHGLKRIRESVTGI
jgi:RNA polymerase sigma-70 factor, ECF subfamily